MHHLWDGSFVVEFRANLRCATNRCCRCDGTSPFGGLREGGERQFLEDNTSSIEKVPWQGAPRSGCVPDRPGAVGTPHNTELFARAHPCKREQRWHASLGGWEDPSHSKHRRLGSVQNQNPGPGARGAVLQDGDAQQDEGMEGGDADQQERTTCEEGGYGCRAYDCDVLDTEGEGGLRAASVIVVQDERDHHGRERRGDVWEQDVSLFGT